MSEVVDGAYTGREGGPFTYREGKAQAIRELADRERIDLDASYAYTDSESDLPMLRLVGHPVAVNPDAELRRIAARGGVGHPALRPPAPPAADGRRAGRRRAPSAPRLPRHAIMTLLRRSLLVAACALVVFMTPSAAHAGVRVDREVAAGGRLAISLRGVELPARLQIRRAGRPWRTLRVKRRPRTTTLRAPRRPQGMRFRARGADGPADGRASCPRPLPASVARSVTSTSVTDPVP